MALPSSPLLMPNPENSLKYPNNSVVVATEEGLARFPERIRRQLVNRWGVVHELRAAAKEVMVHYSEFDSKVVRTELLVPYSVDGNTLELVRDYEAINAWRQSLADYAGFQRRRVWYPSDR